MMDAALQFDLNAPITVSAASTNQIDFGPNRDIGIGCDPLYLSVLVGTTFAAAGSATLSWTLQTSDDPSFGTYTNLLTSQAFGLSALTQGSDLARVPLPVGMRRYCRLSYTVSTGPFTAGALTSSVTPTVQAQRYVPAGYNNL